MFQCKKSQDASWISELICYTYSNKQNKAESQESWWQFLVTSFRWSIILLLFQYLSTDIALLSKSGKSEILARAKSIVMCFRFSMRCHVHISLFFQFPVIYMNSTCSWSALLHAGWHPDLKLITILLVSCEIVYFQQRHCVLLVVLKSTLSQWYSFRVLSEYPPHTPPHFARWMSFQLVWLVLKISGTSR